MKKKESAKMEEQTETAQIQFELIEIEQSSIVHVNSYTPSLSNKFLFIATQGGFVIVDNNNLTYKLYEHQNGPFWTKSMTKDQPHGVKIGALVQNRNQVAIVPNFQSRIFKSTYVYIFDYKMKCILYKNDFFLSIQNISITQSSIIVSNKKRLIIYNYLNDTQEKSQKYYLQQYVCKKQNNRLRYLQTFCDDYEDPFTINQIVDIKDNQCICGKFVISSQAPYRILYIKSCTINNQKYRSLFLYDEKYDKDYQFDSILEEDPFNFTLSSDGNYLAYTTNYGRNIKVFDLKENILLCVLYLGRTINNLFKMQFFNCVIQQKEKVCLCAIREKQNSKATLHIFKIQKHSPTQVVQSIFKRYFNLFEKTFKDYEISENVLSPGLFMKNNILYTYSLCGVVFEVIDFQVCGNMDKKQLQNFSKWTEQKSLTSI